MKALFIGLDYHDTKIKSDYNIHDIDRIRKVFDESEEMPIKILKDTLNTDDVLYPTYENITREVSNFITEEPGMNYLFVYCGCSRDKYDKIKDEDGERVTSNAPTVTGILPRGKNTEIIDAIFLREMLVSKLPESSKLTCIISSNYGHELLPTTFIYSFKHNKFTRSSLEPSGPTKNVLCISFSSDEISPIEISLMAPEGPIRGSLGIFAMLGLIEDTVEATDKPTFAGFFQALLKRLVANNPSKHKTYNMLTIGSENAFPTDNMFFS